MKRLPYVVLVALALGIFAAPLLHRELFAFRDHSDYFQPMRWYTATTIRAGQLPLWNPYSASGEPWLANPQTAVFYPPAWLFLVLPFATAYMLYLFLHVALLGCGAFLLFSRRASAGAALIGATALMFCGPTLSLLDVQNNLTTFAWLPLVIWCGLARAPKLWSAAAIAMSFLAGEPFFAAVGALIFAIVRRRDIADVAAQSFALSAIQLIPFLAMLRGSDRAATIPPEQLLRDSMPFADWLRIAVPPSLLRGAAGQHFIPIVYVGFVTCGLAVLGLFAGRRILAWLALLLFAVLLAAGPHFLVQLPLALIRYPARLVPLAAFAIIAMAVEGWELLSRFIRFRWLAVPVALALAFELITVARPLLVTKRFAPVVPYDRSIGRDSKIVRAGAPEDVRTNRGAWIGGYLNLYDRRFDVWTAAPLASQRYTELYERAMSSKDMSLLNAMSAGYVLSSRPLAFEPVARAGSITVYRNRAALPLAYARDARGAIIAAPSLLAFGTTFIHAVIDVPAPSTMTVTQQRAEGWSANVDGNAVKLERSGDFLAFPLPAGQHDVMLRYRSTPLLAGALLTLLAVVRMLLPKRIVK